MSAEAPLVVRATRTIPAARQRVYEAWLSPELLGSWMFGPAVRDEEIVHLEVDAKVGGHFSFLVRRADQEIDHVGEYLELNPPNRLVFTWATRDTLPDNSRVIVELAPLPSGTQIALSHEMSPAWADYAERVEQSWACMLEALDRALA